MEIEYATENELTPDHDRYENKSETKQVLNDLMVAFEQFKQANDDRLDTIEKHQSVDVLVNDKVDRINKAVDELMIEVRRPALNGLDPERPAAQHDTEYKAFQSFLRNGQAKAGDGVELRAISGAQNTSGGYLVPDVINQEILRYIKLASPLRQLAEVISVSRGRDYKKIITDEELTTKWVGEIGARSATDTPDFTEVEITIHEQYANACVSPTLLTDSVVDINQWLIQAIRDSMANLEDAAFVNGSGVNQPHGFLKHPVETNGTPAWGRLTAVKSGVSDNISTTDYGAKFIDMVFSLPSKYRRNAHVMMNRATQAKIRKIRDEAKQYIWLPPATPKGNSNFLGFPVMENENMPNISANSIPVAIGDFKAGYLIVDRKDAEVIRDPYSSKPYVLYYTTRRVGGAVQNYDAFRVLRIAS